MASGYPLSIPPSREAAIRVPAGEYRLVWRQIDELEVTAGDLVEIEL